MMLGIIQARMSSRRFPGKVLRPLLGVPMLARQIERLQRSRTLDRLVVATSTDASDDGVAEIAAATGVACHRGSLDDVLDRFVGAARAFDATAVVRLTGDCPLADPDVIDAVVRLYHDSGADYASNTNPPTYPDGLDVEVMRMDVLEQAARDASKPSEREHVTLHIHQQPDRFRLVNLASPSDLSALRWTVDTPADFDFVSAIYAMLHPTKPDFRMADILALLQRHPDLTLGMADHERNEGLAHSLRQEQGKNSDV